MPHRGSLHAECLSLVNGLYAALGDDARYAELRARCEAWLFRGRARSEAMAAFLRHQLARAAEARQVAHEAGMMPGGGFAVVAVGEHGEVLAAGPDAWTVFRSGDPARSPLHLPASLLTHLADVSSPGGRPPRALRLQLDAGPHELAALLLGVDEMPGRRTGTTVRLATLVVWPLEGIERAATPRVSEGAPYQAGTASSSPTAPSAGRSVSKSGSFASRRR